MRERRRRNVELLADQAQRGHQGLCTRPQRLTKAIVDAPQIRAREPRRALEFSAQHPATQRLVGQHAELLLAILTAHRVAQRKLELAPQHRVRRLQRGQIGRVRERLLDRSTRVVAQPEVAQLAAVAQREQGLERGFERRVALAGPVHLQERDRVEAQPSKTRLAVRDDVIGAQIGEGVIVALLRSKRTPTLVAMMTSWRLLPSASTRTSSACP